MPQSPRTPGAPTLVLRVSVPAGGEFGAVAADLAVKVAEYLGHRQPEATSAGMMIRELAAEVVPRGNDTADITFEFRQTNDELRIEARCGGRSSHARHPLPT